MAKANLAHQGTQFNITNIGYTKLADRPRPKAAESVFAILAILFALAVPASAQDYRVFFATPQEEKEIRALIDQAQPKVYPLAVIVLDREKFREAERIYKTPQNQGEFTHNPSRRIYLLRPVLHGHNTRRLITHALAHLELGGGTEDEAEQLAARMRSLEPDYESEFLPVVKQWVRDERIARKMAKALAEVARDRQRILPCEEKK